MNKEKEQSGFTLIEILVVIGIIAILAVIVLIAINPGRQFAQSRDTQRTSNVNALLNAIGQRMADNKGVFEGSFFDGTSTTTCPIITTGADLSILSGGTAGSGEVNLSCLVPTYIPALPTDPKHTSSNGNDTLYDIFVNSSTKRTTVKAPLAEINKPIEIER